MLKKEDFAYFGKFLKPHGTKGEIGLQTDTIALDEGFDFVACDIDGILVPFFFENVRSKGSDTLIVKVERLESAGWCPEWSAVRSSCPLLPVRNSMG